MKKQLFLILCFVILFIFASEAKAAKIFLTPSSGSFLVGSTFNLSVVLDTQGLEVNAVRADLDFPSDKLQIVSPSSGKSFISIWLEQPSYSNQQGRVSFAGGMPEGINTSSGVITTITFRVVKSGEAVIKVLPSSSALAHDGRGTEILENTFDSYVALRPRPPEGPFVFSQTHADETRWYNNAHPVISWEKEPEVSSFSFVLDKYPQTVPDNSPDSEETAKSYEDLENGLWYFHIKAQKEGAWGPPSHFTLRIDSTPPAGFEPEVELVMAKVVGRAFVSFFTTDALSGLSHYEVAVIDKEEEPLEAPVFVEAESPFQLPKFISGNLRVIVRAIDKAGNIREATADVGSTPFLTALRNNVFFIVLAVLFLIAAYCLILRKRKKGR